MGHDDMAVVTPDVKLRVPSSNTNAPTIMVGEKGADIILGREPLPPAVFASNRAA